MLTEPIGTILFHDLATIEGVVDRLRQKDMVLIEPIQNDKRRILLSLTLQKAVMIDNLKDTGHTVTRETPAPLTTPKRQKFIKLLKKITRLSKKYKRLRT